jgi:predicted CoA-substrate-specific enzyme activase
MSTHSLTCGIDVGSTTCKYVLCDNRGEWLAQSYERHYTRQAEKVLEFLRLLERDFDLTPGRDSLLLTGSGSASIAPLLQSRVIQEVVAVAGAVEAMHPDVHFVSEIGGEDMKTLFLSGAGGARSRQVFMQNACSGGTGTFIEKIAGKLKLSSEALAGMRYLGLPLHRISSKCGIFAEADANTLLKTGVPVEEIIASLFDAVVLQNLSTLTRGKTPLPAVLLLGGPNQFFRGLREAWLHHLTTIWKERGVSIDGEAKDLVRVPDEALYYAAMGCIQTVSEGDGRAPVYRGTNGLARWIKVGRDSRKREQGGAALWRTRDELKSFERQYAGAAHPPAATRAGRSHGALVIGCDFGSTTAKAVCMTRGGEVLDSVYALSHGNPLDDARALFASIRERTDAAPVQALGLTGYGKNLLETVVGADLAIVETVAHATAGLHFYPDTDCICDVGGSDVKIMLLKNGAVYDFRLNSQCSSGNGAFLQGLAERFGIALEDIAARALSARMMPQLAMGCGVFLQSDIVNQQRKGWSVDEILAALCAVLPRNVWVYAGGINNFARVGRKYVLQGGTHRNLAVVKAQVDFIRSKVPDAEIVVHPYCGEAGAIGAALVAARSVEVSGKSRFRGYEAMERLRFKTTTSADTRCRWCENRCQRTFVDVRVPRGPGRPHSKIPLQAGWDRIIVNNSCPKGLIEDPKAVKRVNESIDSGNEAYPDVGKLAHGLAFRKQSTAR